MRKTYEVEELQVIVERYSKKGESMVFTNGCFDLLHVGHTRYLERARERGHGLIVGLNSDSSVRTLKGEHRPIIPQEERAEILSSLEVVDYVVLFYEKTASRILSLLKPPIYVKGGNYTMEELPEAKTVQGYGGRIVIEREIEGSSTTEIIKRILKRGRL